MSAEQRNLGKYRLVERLAHGGMGEVWKALDTQLQRYVAIKLLRADWQDDPDFVARFEREAQLIASLHHPNIVKIHNFHFSHPPESETTKVYMVMDYVQGQTLADYIRSTSRKGIWPSAADIIYIFTGTSLALDYAHQRGMIHRDIKPANILLDQRMPTPRPMGEPILTDFGIARLQGVSAGTAVGSVIGTPLYMAPEQARGEFDDKRSDLYALGIILYEMMTGVTPFRGGTQLAIIMQHVHDMPTPPALINPHITPELSEVILKSIAKKPEERFPSASAMTTALAEAFNMPVPRPLIESARRATGAGSGNLSSSSSLVDTPGAQNRQATGRVPAMNPRYNPVTPIFTDDSYWLQALPQNPTPTSSPVQPQSLTPTSSPVPLQNPAQTPPPLVSARPQPAVKEPRRIAFKRPNGLKMWHVMLVALLIVLLSSGLGVFLMTSSHNSVSDNTVVGQIHLSKSAPSKGYDTLQIDIEKVPNPHAGFAYYAWIETPENESNAPHWKLQVNQGAIHVANLSDPRFNDLLYPNGLFLISEEQINSIPPVVPDLTTRLYYAKISRVSSVNPVFDVRHCPSSINASGTCV
ncbi:MAG TPA: protein kinase [Ktedonobacteraceae bacterium]|nr:protein kinase [Ktedonobacteraceae bacterium]